LRRVALPILLGTVLVLAVPGLAWALDWVEGDGYRFRLPDDFVRAEISELEGLEDADQVMDLMNGMLHSSSVDVDMQLYLRHKGSAPDAVLFVMAMHLEGEMKEAVEDQFSLAHMEAAMQQAKAELEARSAPVSISRVRRILVSASRPALEIEMSIDDPTVGDLDTARMLFVIEGGTICMLGYQGTTARSAEDGMLWRAIVTSFRLDERDSMMAMLMRYGPFIVGGLIMLIAVLVLRRSSSPKRIQLVHAGGLDGEAAGFSRALDGLPTYGDETPEAQESMVTAADPVYTGARTRSGPGTAPPVPRKIARATPAEGEEANGFGAPPPGSPSAPRPTIPVASAGPLENHPRPRTTRQEPAPVRQEPPRSPYQAPPSPYQAPSSPYQAPSVDEEEGASGFGGFAAQPQPQAPPPEPPPRPRPPLDEPLPSGADLPTNVALRSASAGQEDAVPEAATADEVLSRLMGFDGPPGPPSTQVPTQRKIAKAGAEKKDGEGLRIQRNADFYEE